MMQEYNLYNLDDVTNEDKIPMYITDYKHKRIAIEIKQNQRRYGRKEIEPKALRHSEGKRRQARLHKGRKKGKDYLF